MSMPSAPHRGQRSTVLVSLVTRVMAGFAYPKTLALRTMEVVQSTPPSVSLKDQIR